MLSVWINIYNLTSSYLAQMGAHEIINDYNNKNKTKTKTNKKQTNKQKILLVLNLIYSLSIHV